MPDLEKTTTFLARVPLFHNLKKSQVERLGGRVVSRQYKAGQDIVTQGKGGAGLFVIVSGGAEAVRVRADGTKTVVNTFGPTDFFGELALLDDEPRTASVTATEDTDCLVLSQWEFLGSMREDSEMAIVILQELAKRFRRTLSVL
ncbi:MAG: cyclic nucleotide-binding domain-containing protein [Anaerolineae bacterium]|nr:cyclic nucleotide-binding domain-containing protein [Anaerolineae bacterium]